MQRDNLAALQPDSLIQLPQGGLITGHTKLNAPARAVWNIVGNFGGFAAFIPPLAWIEMTGSGVRSIRKKFFRDGNIVMEQLNARDDEKCKCPGPCCTPPSTSATCGLPCECKH